MSVSKTDTIFTDPEKLRLLYLNPRNPLGGLSETNEKPDIAQNSPTVTPVTPPILNNCPAVGQFILIQNFDGGVIPVLVQNLKVGEFAWHPLLKTFHKVIKTDIIENQPCVLVKTESGAETICTLSEPIIRSFADETGASVYDLLDDLEKAHGVVTVIDYETLESEIASITMVGVRDVVHISLEDGFIYTAGTNPSKTIVRHNKAPINPNNPNNPNNPIE